MMARNAPGGPFPIARRYFLKQAAAAGLVAGAPAIPVLAQEKGSLADTLARYAASLKYEDLPEDIVRLTKRTILDTIGCTFGGYDSNPSKIAVKLAGEVTAKQPATVLISGTRTSPDLASFANGVMIRYLDFNPRRRSPQRYHRSTAQRRRGERTQRTRPHHRDRAVL
jgi:2-methylcitrate dehydratase